MLKAEADAQLQRASRLPGRAAMTLQDAAGIGGLTVSHVVLLLYVQLGFVDRLEQLALGPARTRYVLAAMGLAGFATSLAAPLLLRARHPVWVLRLGFLISFLAIALSMVSGAFPLLLLAAAGMSLGLSLGYVSLVATARPAFRARRVGVKVGLGTGLAYAICNVPWVFLSSPEAKGLVSLVACAAGALMTFAMRDAAPPENLAAARTGEEHKAEPAGFISILMIFFSLVWLDSGAFAIILDNPTLRLAFWGTETLQWRNSVLHIASALLGGWLIDRGRLRSTLTLSYLVIVLAIHLLQQPTPMALLASAGYVCAASLYTVALFAYAPACLGPDGDSRLHGRWVLFALAAWVGSTLGIGMMQELHAVPAWAMVSAGGVIGAALLAAARASGTAPLSAPRAPPSSPG
jgi:hypothetical protein